MTTTLKEVKKYRIASVESEENRDQPVSIEMSKQAEILHVGLQNGEIYIWALIDRWEELKVREEVNVRIFKILATDESIRIRNESVRHIGSVLVKDGTQVYHLFEFARDDEQKELR